MHAVAAARVCIMQPLHTYAIYCTISMESTYSYRTVIILCTVHAHTIYEFYIDKAVNHSTETHHESCGLSPPRGRNIPISIAAMEQPAGPSDGFIQ